MQNTTEFTEQDAGCYFDSHRGHYIVPAVIDFAHKHGFIIGQFESFALSVYDDCYHEDRYPNEALIELCDDAERWLNSGHFYSYEGKDRISGQNAPPKIPEGMMWQWQDGDFGLYAVECEDCGNCGTAIGAEGYYECHATPYCQRDV